MQWKMSSVYRIDMKLYKQKPPVMPAAFAMCVCKNGVTGLVMEQADMGHRHGHIVFVAGGNDIIIADGAACLGDVAHAALAGTLDIVAKREEGVGAEGYTSLGSKPFLLFLARERSGLFCEEMFPIAIRQQVFTFFADIDINGIIAIRAAHFFFEGQVHDLRALAQIPDIGLVAS